MPPLVLTELLGMAADSADLSLESSASTGGSSGHRYQYSLPLPFFAAVCCQPSTLAILICRLCCGLIPFDIYTRASIAAFIATSIAAYAYATAHIFVALEG